MKTGINQNIEKRFNKFIIYNLIIEILLIILGIVLIIFPNMMAKTMGIIISIFLFLYAASLMYDFLKRDGAKLYSLNLVFAIIIFVLGILLLVYPYSIMNFVANITGIFFITTGAVKINHAIWLKRAKEESWLPLLITSVTVVIVGLMLLFNPFAYLDVTRVIGVFIILTSILRISNAHLFKKRSNEILKIFW